MTLTLSTYFIGSCIAVLAGLDRMAAMQTMFSRPIVVAPLTGFVLGNPMVGLQIGALLELLWLGRLPVGASIPPDDTQIAVGATALCLSVTPAPTLSYQLLCLLVVLPLGKIGEFFERGARHLNLRLSTRAEALCDQGEGGRAERQHLIGLFHFALASLCTFSFVYWGGSFLLGILAPWLLSGVSGAASWLYLLFPLVGAGCILASINVQRAPTLFLASFVSVSLLLWLL